MNIRSLTRGDGAVIGAAVLLLIASFLPYFSISGCDSCSTNSWHAALMPTLGGVHLAALACAGLFVAARAQGERQLMGIGLRQWGRTLSVYCAWESVWSLFQANSSSEVSLGAGAYLTLIFAVALAVAAVIGENNPALKGPLLGAPKPAAPQGYAQQPYAPGPGQPGGGYGYPGGQPPTYGGQPQQPGAPLGATMPAPGQVTDPGAGDGGEFTPFWFAVPVARPLYPEDGSPNPLAELTPGTWYLAVDQRGAALVAQTQDGRRGVLQDTTGIQRG